LLNIQGQEKEHVLRYDKPMSFMDLKSILGNLFIVNAHWGDEQISGYANDYANN
jgi:hypothetical protein